MLKSSRSNHTLVLYVALFVVMFIFVLAFYFIFRTTPEEKAEDVVKQFYEYEQKGEFGSSWELFHDEMKKRFDQATYIQVRTQLMKEDFGVETFEFEIGETEKLSSWQISSDSQVLQSVYKIPVTQYFQSTFGNFSIVKNAFVAKAGEEWFLLWSYHDKAE